MLKYLTVALLGSAVLLSGCASSGTLDGRKMGTDVGGWAASVEAQASQMRQGVLPPGGKDAAPSRAVADSASVAELYAAGIGYNPQIRVARSRIAVADAELTNAAMRFFPSLNGTVTNSHVFQNILGSDNQVFQRGKADYGTLNAAIEARMPLMNLENVFNYKKTDTQQRRGQIEYIGAAQSFIRDLMVTYVDLAETNAIIAEYRQRISLLQGRASSERSLQSAGTGSPEVALGYEQELSDAQAQLAVQEARRMGVIVRIEELTGTRIDAVRGQVNPGQLTLPVDDLDGLIALTINNNPNYLAKRYEVAAFKYDADRARARDFAPTLDAFASQEYEDRGGSQFGGGSETVQTVVGIQLRAPIFNGGGQGYETNTATARIDLAEAELAMLASETKAAVATSYANFLAAKLRVQRDGNTLNKGSQLISLVNQRISDQGGTTDDGLDARLDQASYQRQRQQSQFQMVREWVQLKYLTGALSEADIRVFSSSNS